MSFCASGAVISLKRTLDKALLPAGLSYVLINKNQVYITDQAPFVTSLPSYKEGSFGDRCWNNQHEY